MPSKRQQDDVVKQYKPLLGLIEPYIDAFWEDVSTTVQCIVKDRTPELVYMWNHATPAERRKLATASEKSAAERRKLAAERKKRDTECRAWAAELKKSAAASDMRHDPANEEENNYWEALMHEVDKEERHYRELDLSNPHHVPSEIKLRRDALDTSTRRLRDLKALYKQLPFTVSDWDALSDANRTKPAAGTVVTDASAKAGKNKSPKTLAFDNEVIRLMTFFWNSRTTGTEPNKGDLHMSVHNEMLRGKIRGHSKKLNVSMVRDAAKPWTMPVVLPSYVPPAQTGGKRHPFKGDK